MNAKSHKKLLIIGGSVVAALLVIALAYVLVMPSKAATSYTTSAKTAHDTTATAMDKVYSSFSNPIFTNTELSPADGKAQVKQIQTAITDAEAALAQNETKATKLNGVVAGSISSKYKDAKKLSQDETKYFTDAKAFLGQYKEVVTYLDKGYDDAIQAEAGGTELALALYSEVEYDKAVARLEAAISKIDGVLSNQKKLTVPASFASYHAESLTEGEKLLASMRALLDAWKNEDVEKELSTTMELEAMIAKASETDTHLVKFQTESEISKAVEKLQNQQRELRGRF